MDKILKKLAPYKYPLLMLVIGIVIMTWPKGADPPVVTPVVTASMESRMGELLSKAQGAGEVEVMLQYENDGETVYLQDTSQPTVVETKTPRITGALVLAQGADSPTVRLNLVNAVSNLTGLGADKITVISS